MDKIHFMKFQNKEYIGSWDVPQGGDLIVTIKGVRQAEVTGQNGKKEQCMVIDTDYKPMVCNVTNGRLIAAALGSAYIDDWIGRPISLYTARVNAYGDQVDALRVRPTAPQPAAVCSDCGGTVGPAWGKTAQQVAEYTLARLGKVVCSACAERYRS